MNMGPSSSSWARQANVVLGVWLILSTFLWPHGSAQTANSLIVGLLEVAFAFAAIYVPVWRHANAILAAWLFVSVFSLPSANAGTAWNNVVVAVLTFFFSLSTGPRLEGPGAREDHAHT